MKNICVHNCACSLYFPLNRPLSLQSKSSKCQSSWTKLLRCRRHHDHVKIGTLCLQSYSDTCPWRGMQSIHCQRKVQQTTLSLVHSVDRIWHMLSRWELRLFAFKPARLDCIIDWLYTHEFLSLEKNGWKWRMSSYNQWDGSVNIAKMWGARRMRP